MDWAMVTESPSTWGQDKATGSEMPKPVEADGSDITGDSANESSLKLSFAMSEPLREDLVQNAVKFLSYPRVRSSPVIYRHSFLESKGLTKEEIDEAFRRALDPPSAATNLKASTTNSDMQPISSVVMQPQAPVQHSQPAVAPENAVSVAPNPHQSRYQWFQVLGTAGVLAASGAAGVFLIKKIVVPRLKGWIPKVVAKENESKKEAEPSSKLGEIAAEAAEAAASAAALVAKASQEMLNTKNAERKYFESFMKALDVQVKEMKSMSDSIHRLESRWETILSQDKLIGEHAHSTSGNGPIDSSWRSSQVSQSDHFEVDGTPNKIFGEVRPSSTPASIEPISRPNSSACTELWEVSQRAQQRCRSCLQLQPRNKEMSSKAQGILGSSSQMDAKAYDTSVSELRWRNKRMKII